MGAPTANCTSQPRPPLAQLLPLAPPEPLVPPAPEPIHRIRPRPLRRHPLGSEHGLQLLVVPRRLMLADDPEEERDGVLGQAGAGARGEGTEQALGDVVGVEEEGGAAGAAVVVGHADAVDVGLVDVRVRAEDGADLGRGDVLAPPPEGVADAVAEPPSALAVPPDHVPGAAVRVPCDEDVAEDFTLGRGRVVEIALEFRVGVCGVDLENQLPRLARLDLSAETMVERIAERQLGRPIHLHNGALTSPDQRRKKATSADGPARELVGAEVPRRAHAFGRSVELANGVNAEALLEPVPHVWPETVSDCFGDLVHAVEVLACDGIILRLGREQIATCFAYVLDSSRIMLTHFVPEGGGGEAMAEDQCVAVDHGGA